MVIGCLLLVWLALLTRGYVSAAESPQNDTPSSSANLSTTSSYDPNVCAVSWISWMKWSVEYMTSKLEYSANLAPYITSWSTNSALVPVVSTQGEGITYTDCESRTRISWTTSSLITTLKPPRDMLFEILGLSTPSSTPQYKSTPSLREPKSERSPSCTIQQSDCDNQWSLLVSWTTTFSNSKFDSVPTNGLLFLEEHLNQRYWSRVKNTDIFGGCKIEKSLCYSASTEQMLWPYVSTDLSSRFDTVWFTKSDYREYVKTIASLDVESCWANIGQFAVIYFPETNRSKEVCPTQQVNPLVERSIDQRKDDGKPVLAILPNITFHHYTYANYFQQSSIMYRTETTLQGPFTFTSPSVYVAYDSAAVWKGCSWVGKDLEGGILTLSSGQLRSLSLWLDTTIVPGETRYHMTYKSLDLNDFQTPIPASAYFAVVPECVDTNVIPWSKKAGCTAEPITEGVYRPILDIPGELKHHDPAWQSCSRITLHSLGVPDPPIALTMVGTNHENLQLPSAAPSEAFPVFQGFSRVPPRTDPPAVQASPGPAKTTQQPSHPYAVLPTSSASSAASSLLLNMGQSEPKEDTARVITVHSTVITMMAHRNPDLTRSPGPLPVKEFQFAINGQTLTGYIAGDEAIIGSRTLHTGGPEYITGSRTISLKDGSIFIDGSMVTPIGTQFVDDQTTYDDPTENWSSTSASRTSSSKKKKSGSGRSRNTSNMSLSMVVVTIISDCIMIWTWAN